MPAAGFILSVAASAAALIGVEATIVASLAFAATVASYATARRQRKKAQQRAEEQANEAERSLLQSRRRYRDIGLAPRQVVYGRVAHAGVLTYAAPNQIPTFGVRATNSMVFALSARPVDRFNAAILREKFLGDFDEKNGPGAHGDSTLLDFPVPATPDPAPATDPGPKIGAGDARLFASLGHDASLRVPDDPGLFGSLRTANSSGEMKMYGCAWSAHLIKQIDPETNEGLSSTGRPDIMWDMLGARVRNPCKQGSGRRVLGWRASPNSNQVEKELEEIELIAAVTAADGAWGESYFKLGVLPFAGLVGDAEIWGNAAAKVFRDAMVVAAGGTVVEEPTRDDDVEFVSSATADLIGRQTAALARPLTDFLIVRVQVLVGSATFVLDFDPAAIISAGAAGVSKSVSAGGDGVLLDADHVYLWKIGDNLEFDIRAQDGTSKISTYQFVKVEGLAPISDRAAALAAFNVFLLSDENDTAVRQLHFFCEDLTGAGAAPAGTWSDVVLFSATTEATEDAWNALPVQFSQNPVLTFLDWVTDRGRPSGFKVNMRRQLDLLPGQESDADYCETLLRLHSASFSSLFTGQSRYYALFVWNGSRRSFPAVRARVTYDGVTKEVTLVAAKSGGSYECERFEGGDSGRGYYTTTCSSDVAHGTYDDFDEDVVFGAGANAVTVRIFGDALFEHAHSRSAKMDVNAYVSKTEDPKFGGVEFFGTGYGGKGGSVRTTDHGLVTDVEGDESAARQAAAAATHVSLVGVSGSGALGVLPVATGNVNLGAVTLKITRSTDQELTYALEDSNGDAVDAVLEWWAPRFRFNGIVSMGDSERRNLRLWQDSVLGDVYDEGGALRLRVARWTEPVATLTAEDFAREGSVDWSPSEPVEQIRTAMSAAYLDVNENWNEKETEPVEDKVALRDSGGIKRTESVVMPFANSEWEATAMTRLRVSLARHSGRMTIGLLRWDAARFERGDRVRLSAGLFGFKRETTWRVESLRFVFPRGVSLTLQEDVEEAYRDEFLTTPPRETLDYFEGPEVTSSGAALTFMGENVRE